ncbi:MAG: AbrB/MazE/SpoVT family DNA-binding domain-containing protein [Acidobacteriaceae bacterium]|nr:AbrB/MazE/SpoVT family DNA-binding domain-containing protein [Acidobacteriaceae bacterium]
MADTVTVSSKGQVVIPLAVRELLHLGPGSALRLEVHGNDIVLSKGRDWREFEGIFKRGDSLTEALIEERQLDKTLED